MRKSSDATGLNWLPKATGSMSSTLDFSLFLPRISTVSLPLNTMSPETLPLREQTPDTPSIFQIGSNDGDVLDRKGVLNGEKVKTGNTGNVNGNVLETLRPAASTSLPPAVGVGPTGWQDASISVITDTFDQRACRDDLVAVLNISRVEGFHFGALDIQQLTE